MKRIFKRLGDWLFEYIFREPADNQARHEMERRRKGLK